MSRIRIHLMLGSFTLFALSTFMFASSQRVDSTPACYTEDENGQVIDLSYMCEQDIDNSDIGTFEDAAYQAEYARICKEESCSTAADAIRVHLKVCENLGINPGVVGNSNPTGADRLALEQAIRDSEEWLRIMGPDTDDF